MMKFAEDERKREMEQKAGLVNDVKDADEEAGRLFHEQVQWLYSQAPVGLFATALNSLVLTAVLWRVVPQWRLIVWLVLSLAVVLARYILVLLHRQSPAEAVRQERWTFLFLLGLLASGVLMGSSAIFLFPLDSVPHQIFLAFVLGGMVAGATSAYSVMQKAFLAYSLPIIVPITLRLLTQNSNLDIAMGGLLLLFYGIMLNTARNVRRTFTRSLRLHLEKSELVEDLMAAKSQAEDVVAKLEREMAERKNAESALQESEKLFRMLVETMNDGLALQDSKGVITYVNERLGEMLERSPAELLGVRLGEFVAAADRACLEAEMANHYYAAVRTSCEIQMVKKHGSPVATIVSMSPVFDERGSFAGSIAAITDITVLKQATMELRESEEKYRMIFENSPLGIAHFDRNGTITAYNENLAKMSDSSRDEFIGLNPLQYLQDEAMKAAIHECLSGRSAHYEGDYRSRRTGKITPIKADFSPILAEDGTVLGGAGIIQDISEQKRAEKEMGEQLHFLQMLIDSIPSPIFYKDLEGLYVGCNKAFEKRLGLRRDQIVGKTVFDVMPEDLAQKYHEMDLMLFRNRGEQIYETSLIYPDHTHRDIILSKATYTDMGGNLAGLVGVSIDITDRKKAEEALRKARDELEMRVQERTAALAKAVEELRSEVSERKKAEEALRIGSEKLKLFAYSVIHDLKSPAIGVYGVARLLFKNYEGSLDDRAKTYCQQIQKASEHIAALVEQINVYMIAKEAPITVESVDVNGILKMIQDEFSAQLSLRKIRWQDLQCPVHIHADRLSIHRVFRNLVDNALKYGGENLSEIKIEYEEQEQYHVFSVRDDGVGVAREDSEKIFGVFARNASSKGVSGTGLGLAIIKEIAERHGGEVWVEPASPHGTTFYVSIAKDLK